MVASLNVHAEVARSKLAGAGLAKRVEDRVGPALESLAALEVERAGPFDLVCVDADRVNGPTYLRWALALTRPGSLLAFDNVDRGSAVTEADSTDPSVQATRRLLDLLAAEPRVAATAIQTVGETGLDVELYTNSRIEEFLESAEMTEDELAGARDAWGL